MLQSKIFRKFWQRILLFISGAGVVYSGVCFSKTGVQFEKIILDNEANGPAFASVHDLDGDGRDEVIVSKFGKIGGISVPNGEVTIFKRGDSLSEWQKIPLVKESDGIKFPNHPVIHDFSKDGLPDIMIPAGFLACEVVPFGRPCGSITLYENKGDHFKKHTLIASGYHLFFHHAVFLDLDHDGIEDFISVGERMTRREKSATTFWFKGKSEAPWFESTPRVLSEGLGGLPVLIDLNGDGKKDLASAEYFYQDAASFAWLEQVEPVSSVYPDGLWRRHIIDDEVGPSIMLKIVDNFFGDGKARAIGSNHSNTTRSNPDPWESAIYAYEIPENPAEPWPRVKISEGIVSRPGNMFNIQAAPGIFGTGDLNADGRIDVLVSGDGDDRVFLLEQTAPGQFKTHVIAENFGQAGAMLVHDLDGDGKNEGVISSYESSKVIILKQSH